MSIQKVTSPVVVFCLMTSHAQAENDKRWEFSGQINLAYMTIDDGVESNDYLTDNDNSNSRFRLTYRIPYQGDGSFRFNLELGLGLQGSFDVSPEADKLLTDYNRFDNRVIELVYDNDDLGMLSFGQGSMATDGVADNDLSGTSVAISSSIFDLGGATPFRLEDGRVTGTTIFDAFKNLDGDRHFRVRYDSPQSNGISVAVAYGHEVIDTDDDRKFFDASAFYSSENAAYKMIAGLGYAWVNEQNDSFLGSASILHKPTGLNATFAGGAQHNGGEYLYMKMGLTRDWVSIGETHLAAEYYSGWDFAFPGADARMIGLAFVQNLERYSVEIYGMYRTNKLSSDVASFQDIDLMMLGARWKF